MLFQVELGHQMMDIAKNFLTAGETPRPVRVRREGIGIQVGGNVTGGPGILVIPPGATHGVASFQNHEIIDAGLLETNGHAQTREAGTNNQH